MVFVFELIKVRYINLVLFKITYNFAIKSTIYIVNTLQIII